MHSVSTYRLRKHPKKGICKLDVQAYPRCAEGLRMQLAHEVVMRRNGFIRSSSHKCARGLEKLQKQVEAKRGVEQNQLISLGCGAYGFINGTFYWNTKSLSEYGKALHAGRLPVWIGQQLDYEERMRKSMAMGMHTGRGVCISSFEYRYGQAPNAVFGETIDRLPSLVFSSKRRIMFGLRSKAGFLAMKSAWLSTRREWRISSHPSG